MGSAGCGQALAAGAGPGAGVCDGAVGLAELVGATASVSLQGGAPACSASPCPWVGLSLGACVAQQGLGSGSSPSPVSFFDVGRGGVRAGVGTRDLAEAFNSLEASSAAASLPVGATASPVEESSTSDLVASAVGALLCAALGWAGARVGATKEVGVASAVRAVCEGSACSGFGALVGFTAALVAEESASAFTVWEGWPAGAVGGGTSASP